ncbi:MAG: isopenicillin N synthase family dioxygenase [Acidimicrobiales bacterium]
MALTEQPQAATDLIPVLDLEALTNGEARAAEALGPELRQALEDVGFFFVVNHGVPWTLVDQIYGEALRLHAEDPERLAAISMDGQHGGYLKFAGGTSYASDIAGEVRTPNLNAAFFAHLNGYRLANRWPELDGFRDTVETYIEAAAALGQRLLPVLAASLDLPLDFFDEHFDKPSCTLRLSHYPVLDYGEHDWGLAPHTDSSIMTMLPVNDVPGLEIRPAGHDWIEPPALPESYLINSGDMLKRWTNNRFRSTAHRARNNSTVDRYAIPFFFGARDDALVEAVPTCVDDAHPAEHEPITYGDYQRWFLNRNYAKLTGQSVGANPDAEDLSG